MNGFIVFSLVFMLWACKTDSQSTEPVSAEAFYVDINGNDHNPGTFKSPWGTWQKAFLMAGPGDTVYIRGGVYSANTNDPYGVFVSNKKGSKSKPICIFNYPGETPILDCSTITNSLENKGILLYNCSYFHIKGLVVTGVSQHLMDTEVCGFGFDKGDGHVIEQCLAHNVQGPGFWIHNQDTTHVIQCDAYDNFDVSTEGYSGGQADGFVISYSSKTSYTHLMGCRSWFNSDDGYDCWKNEGKVVFDRCWAFNNGRADGDGGGFKLGRTDDVPLDEPQRILRNCMAFYNRLIGFNQNDGNISMIFYNNIAFENDESGFSIGQFNNSIIARNNISYRNRWPAYFLPANNDHNTWNKVMEVEVTDSDFISIDSTGVSGKRKANGDLPDLDFLRLAEGSDLIDAGIDVGLPYKGNAPDLGPYFDID